MIPHPPLFLKNYIVHIILKDAYGSVMIFVFYLTFRHIIFIFHMFHFLLVRPFTRWLLSGGPSEVYGYTVSSRSRAMIFKDRKKRYDNGY